MVTKYYEQSVTLPRTKRKWFSRQLEQFKTWSTSDFQKWLRTAKRIIRKDKLQTTRPSTTTYTKIAGSSDIHYNDLIYYIIKSPSKQMLNHRKPTTITKYYNSSPLNDVLNPKSNSKTIDNASQLQLTENTSAITKSTNQKVNVTEFRNDNDPLYIPTVSRLKKKKNSVRKTAILKGNKTLQSISIKKAQAKSLDNPNHPIKTIMKA